MEGALSNLPAFPILPFDVSFLFTASGSEHEFHLLGYFPGLAPLVFLVLLSKSCLLPNDFQTNYCRFMP